MKPTPQELTVPQCECIARKFNENCSYATHEEYLQDMEYKAVDREGFAEKPMLE